MASADRKVWSVPRLRVFSRAKPEEMVLASCKYHMPSPGPKNQEARCLQESPAFNCNYNCSKFGVS